MNILNLLYVSKKSKISLHSRIYPFSIISNSVIKDYSYISYSCKINNAVIGKYCSIARGVKIGLGKHPTNFISTSPLFYSPNNPIRLNISSELKFKEFDSVTISNDVWIGTNVVIMDGVNIGNGAIVGANSVVVKDVEPYSIVGGVPAKLIKMRFSTEVIEKLLKLKWWDYPIEKIKKESILEIFSKEVDTKIINKLVQSFKNL